MKHLPTFSVAVVILAVVSSLPACAQATASVLSIASPPGIIAYKDTLRIARDDAGRVMVAYVGKQGRDGQRALYTALLDGVAWGHTVLPTPEIRQFRDMLKIRQLVADGARGVFHLTGNYYGHTYYWRWASGAWSNYEEIGEFGRPQGMVVLPDGTPLIECGSSRLRLAHCQGGVWREVMLPVEMGQRRGDSLYLGGQGAVRALGMRFNVPVLAMSSPGADPMVETNWTVTPTTPTNDMSSPAGQDADEMALDWPPQRIYQLWEHRSVLNLAWAPVGATSEEQWQRVEVPTITGRTHRYGRLVCNGHGGTGLLVCYYATDPEWAPVLNLHWLSASGLGPAIPLLRPGTDTEAVRFQTLDGENMDFCVDAQGTAHIAIVGEKRGEVPADFSRLYYATVTGGGTSTQEPETAGEGTTEMEREGAPPDFIVRILKPQPDDNRVAFGAGGQGFSSSLRPIVEVTNRGAQFFGDLWLEANFDGAVLRIRYPDPSRHTRPLLRRGESHKLYLPDVRYSLTPQPGAEPVTPSFDYGSRDAAQRVPLYTGLGRKQMSVTVDPENAVEEADEDNNSAQAEYIVGDGRRSDDCERDGSGRYVRGLNDLAVLRAPVLLSNTPLLRAGYIQAPTALQVLAGNPLLAGFFLNAEVTVNLDDQEIYRGTMDMLDREPNLASATLGGTFIYDPAGPPPRADISGQLFQVPVDLTNVPEGDHSLTVRGDPEDRFADRRRDNNEVRIDFRVRPPGGTLRARVVDFSNRTAPVPRAMVTLTDLWMGRSDDSGWVEIRDVPGGAYDDKAMSAERMWEQPKFFPGFAPAFTITRRQTTEVTIPLEKPMTVTGLVTVEQTGQLLSDEEVTVLADVDDLLVRGTCTNGHYSIPNVPPGEWTIIAGAYGYETKGTPMVVKRGGVQTDECVLNLTLRDGPRCTLTGTVLERTDQNNPVLAALPDDLFTVILGPRGEAYDAAIRTSDHPLGGAFVWLRNAPRGALTNADGSFAIERVAAAGDDSVWADADNHAPRGVVTGELGSKTGQSIALTPIIIPRVEEKLKTVQFDATTFAICEQTAAAGNLPQITVDSKFGAFTGEVGLMYHKTAGQNAINVDAVAIWLEGGDFIQGGVSTELSLESLTGVKLDVLKVGDMKTLLTGLGSVFSLISFANKGADFLYGDVDPSQMHRNNRVVGTYMSHTGSEYKQDPLFGIPTSTDVPVAVGFHGGGSTVVRVDYIILNDGVHPEHKAYVCWYSPGFAVFPVGEEFSLDALDVKLWVAVLNSRLEAGVLGNTSRNQIWWKPDKPNWLRVEGYAYEVQFE